MINENTKKTFRGLLDGKEFVMDKGAAEYTESMFSRWVGKTQHRDKIRIRITDLGSGQHSVALETQYWLTRAEMDTLLVSGEILFGTQEMGGELSMLLVRAKPETEAYLQSVADDYGCFFRKNERILQLGGDVLYTMNCAEADDELLIEVQGLPGVAYAEWNVLRDFF